MFSMYISISHQCKNETTTDQALGSIIIISHIVEKYLVTLKIKV